MAACGQEKTQDETTSNTDENTEQVSEVDEEPDKEEVSEIPGLELNNGEKWKANPETSAGIEKMTVRIAAFDSQSDTAAYRILTDSLDADFRSIFKHCTMKGEAHNQLHNYLLPMKKMFQQLQAEDQDERLTAFRELEEHLNEYPVFFK